MKDKRFGDSKVENVRVEYCRQILSKLGHSRGVEDSQVHHVQMWVFRA